jgi:hypothetical protein
MTGEMEGGLLEIAQEVFRNQNNNRILREYMASLEARAGRRASSEVTCDLTRIDSLASLSVELKITAEFSRPEALPFKLEIDNQLVIWPDGTYRVNSETNTHFHTKEGITGSDITLERYGVIPNVFRSNASIVLLTNTPLQSYLHNLLLVNKPLADQLIMDSLYEGSWWGRHIVSTGSVEMAEEAECEEAEVV